LSSRQCCAQYERIDEESHNVFDFAQIAVGDWRADADVGLAGVTEKKCIEGLDNNNEAGVASLFAQAAQSIFERCGDGEMNFPASLLRSVTRATRWQIKRRNVAGELRAPISQVII